MITLFILFILSLIPHSNSQCADSEPLTAECSSSNAQCSNTPTATDGMTISLTLCSDNFIYMQITYTQFNNKWLGIRFPNLPLSGSKMHGNAVVYTDDGGEGLYSYTISASNLAGVIKDTPQFWTEVSTDKSTDLTIIYKISIADATTHYNWDLNTNSVTIYYVLATNPTASLTLSAVGHGSSGSSTELTLNFPQPTTTNPTTIPTFNPTTNPTKATYYPTNNPTHNPTNNPKFVWIVLVWIVLVGCYYFHSKSKRKNEPNIDMHAPNNKINMDNDIVEAVNDTIINEELNNKNQEKLDMKADVMDNCKNKITLPGAKTDTLMIGENMMDIDLKNVENNDDIDNSLDMKVNEDSKNKQMDVVDRSDYPQFRFGDTFSM